MCNHCCDVGNVAANLRTARSHKQKCDNHQIICFSDVVCGMNIGQDTGENYPELFLDDTKVKNFITCFKDKQFLVFFFKQLRKNSTGRYQEFPYVSPCGRERNFVRCDDLPVVFTHLMKGEGPEEGELLSYGGAGDKLAVRFEPERLFMPENGRVYHPAPERSGSIGLVKSSLAFELSGHFEYTDAGPESGPPSHFHWNGQRHKLTNELSSYIQNEKPT
ncbi:UPF0598 protein C8orf82 homolog isoform X1 [Heptranchias perlo]|uniref:UPF0598 protein C8orf82 homolog isoform X1 n=1 Tax=Heptranchias perlo TaxID=212740 RepID=UPI003559B71C